MKKKRLTKKLRNKLREEYLIMQSSLVELYNIMTDAYLNGDTEAYDNAFNKYQDTIDELKELKRPVVWQYK